VLVLLATVAWAHGTAGVLQVDTGFHGRLTSTVAPPGIDTSWTERGEGVAPGVRVDGRLLVLGDRVEAGLSWDRSREEEVGSVYTRHSMTPTVGWRWPPEDRFHGVVGVRAGPAWGRGESTGDDEWTTQTRWWLVGASVTGRGHLAGPVGVTASAGGALSWLRHARADANAAWADSYSELVGTERMGEVRVGLFVDW